MSIALFFVFHNLQLSDFNRGFDESSGTILGGNLVEELANRTVLELLLLLFVPLVSSPKSLNRSKIALSSQRVDMFGLDGYRKLFLPSTPSSILLSIISFRLSL